MKNRPNRSVFCIFCEKYCTNSNLYVKIIVTVYLCIYGVIMENKRYDRPKGKNSFDKGAPKGDFKRKNEKIFKERDEIDELGIVIGRNAVSELLKSDRTIDKLYVKKGSREGSLTMIVAQALEKRIPVVEVEGSKLDFMSSGANHQGVVAMAALKDYVDVDTILEIARERNEKAFIVIADCIEDPHNLGAVIRCAECAGAHGIIIPKRHAVGITPAVYKSSAGAIEHVAIAKVSNIATTIEELKKKGVWIFSCEAGGEPYYAVDYDCHCAIVLGSEGNGVGKIIKDKSDFIISIPMYGRVNSLNVSTAASVILCHAARMQRGDK